MTIAIWVLQGFLAFLALPGSIANLTMSPEKLKTTDFYSAAMTPRSGKVMAVWMILGAVGMILPWVLNIYPFLTPLASFNLGLVLITASWIHLLEGVPSKSFITLLFAAGYFFIAYTRFMEWMTMIS